MATGGNAPASPWNDQRYVGFADLLGYKSLVIDADFSEEQRFWYLYSAYESLAIAANEVLPDADFANDVRVVQLSDSYFFSSRSAVKIVTAMAKFFAAAYGAWVPAYAEPPETVAESQWLPVLRGGIVKDWMFEARDWTLGDQPTPQNVFRIPVGPGVAKAYVLSEKTGIDGMRLVCTEAVRLDFIEGLGTLDHAATLWQSAHHLEPIHLKNWPSCGPIHEVPWLELVLQDGNIGTVLESINVIEQQFAGGMKHYRGMWDMVREMPTIKAADQWREAAENRRTEVVRKLAGQYWLEDGGVLWDEWHDWFAAEGKVKPKRKKGS